MKSTLLLLAALLVLMTACSTSYNGSPGGKVSAGIQGADARLKLTKRISGEASITTLQLFGFNFHDNAEGCRVGCLGEQLNLKRGLPLNPFAFLFESPASCQRALDAACYAAIRDANCDAMVQTKVWAQSNGFSLLGFIGYGTATATVDGVGMDIVPGALPVTTIKLQ